MSELSSDLFEYLAECFNQAGLDHVLIGGHAVNAWAEPRFTADVDFTVVTDRAAFERLSVRFAADGWRLDRAHGEDLPSGPDFVRFTHPERQTPVEVQFAKTAFQRELFTRAQPNREAAGLKVATVEDLLVLKLIAFRAKDRGDLAALARRDGVDWAYVERWSKAWDVEDRLRQVQQWVD